MTLTAAQREDIERRVDEGVWFLDHVMPDWADHVDLSRLDMGTASAAYGCACIATQVTGAGWFYSAVEDLGVGEGNEDAILGFDGFGPVEGWAYAHELWQEAVLERRPHKLIGGEAA